MCEICNALKRSKDYIVQGDWTNLSIEKNIDGTFDIVAYGDGTATLSNIKFCPKCGRKLGEK